LIDNKPFEDEAESFIKNKLLRYKFNIAKPTFDIRGADLLILDKIDNKYSKILKVQAKGRTLKSTTNSVTIHESYLTDEFIVFLYAIDDVDKEKEYLFTFFKEDIEQWNKNDENYVLSFTAKSILNESFQSRVFNEFVVQKIKEKLNKSKVKKYTSVIVDGIFIKTAIDNTLARYARIFPERQFKKPSLNDVLLSITAMYNRFVSEENIINYHIYNYNEYADEATFVSGDILIDNQQIENRIYNHETNGFIYSKIEDHFERIINIENIILVADDILYESILHRLKNEGIDIILVKFAKDSRMLADYRWGDIIYPVAEAMGLSVYEL